MAMLYTPQQLAGGSSYSRGVRVGNWYEDIEYQDTKLKDFLAKRETGTLASSRAAQRVALLEVKVPHSYTDNGQLCYGDTIQLESKSTRGTVVGNIFQTLGPVDSQVAVSRGALGPTASSTLVITPDPDAVKAGENASDKVLCYGDVFLLCSNPSLRVDRETGMRRPPLYMTSRKNGFTTKLSGPQTCCMSLNRSRDARWTVVPTDVRRAIMYEGQPVEADAPVLLKHVSSSNYLGCSSKIEDGKKFALVCKNFTAAKTRSCVTYTAENEFTIVTAKKIADSIDDRVFVDMTAGAILGKIQSRVKSRGSYGMRGLGRVFRSMDDAGDGVLDREDFLFGLGDYLGSSMADDELALVVDLFDSNGDGLISLTEFIAKIRGPLSARRKDMIMQAYAILDKDGSGVVNVMDLKDAFDVKAHPEVVSGNKTAEAVLKEFLVQWDKTGDGAVTRGEFLEYYADVSASIDSDDYFELMMRNAWHISGGEGALANTTNRRVLVVYEDGTQTVEEITNDLGIGPKDKDAMIANLTAQGIKGIADVQLSG